jgi:hypothetical protein
MKFTKAAQKYFRELDFKFHRARQSRRTFSQGREEQILAKYMAGLLPAHHSRTAIDIGAGDGMRWSNTYALFLDGWRGVGIEFDSRKFVKLARAYKHLPDVYACRNRATPDNIVPLLASYEIEKDFSVLSLDIVTEINEKIPPPLRFVVKYNPDFQLRHHFFGYSIAMLADLCEEFGYVILELEYNNAFLAPKEFAGLLGLEAPVAYSRGYLDRPDRKEKFSLNFDMETIYSLSEAQALEFLQQFYSKFPGEFYLGLSKDSISENMRADFRP